VGHRQGLYPETLSPNGLRVSFLRKRCIAPRANAPCIRPVLPRKALAHLRRLPTGTDVVLCVQYRRSR
ncbi:hypothetical protein KWH03_13770, partial [Xanthomonas campestris pv. lawsoniae]|uniref:hypothetical protein n=1 Tax=Xanthomonas euvesicatoria TaxID=456327 RepID=UPI001C43E220